MRPATTLKMTKKAGMETRVSQTVRFFMNLHQPLLCHTLKTLEKLRQTCPLSPACPRVAFDCHHSQGNPLSNPTVLRYGSAAEFPSMRTATSNYAHKP